MEIIGLVLAIPAVMLANVLYVLLVRFIFVRFQTIRRWLLWPSYVVVALAVVDVVLIATLGAVASRYLLGSAFWGIHEIVFVLGAPALGNVLLLTNQSLWLRRWYGAAALCCVFGVFLVFFQVGVGDALYGPDGTGGPFSPP